MVLMRKIAFVKDYKITLASQETKIYHKGDVVNCRNEEKAQEMISRGFAVAVDAGGEVDGN